MPYKDISKRNEYFRNWRKKNKEKTKEYANKNYANNREKIIQQKIFSNTKMRRLARLDCIKHYSNDKNMCSCCGENHIEFLAIDHIKGNGNEHRKSLKDYLPLILKRKKYPKGYRILCHNCNSSIGFYGYCPHQKDKIK